MKNNSMFGKNFKYVLVLTALAWITYTMPSVRAALDSAYVPVSNTAAAVEVAKPISSLKSTSTVSLIKSSAQVNVLGRPKLEVKYDSSKKESSLKATFTISVTGGRTGVYIDTYQPIRFTNSTPAPSSFIDVNGRLMPVTKSTGPVTGKAIEAYYVAPNKTAIFTLSASVDPKILFAGSYTASIVATHVYLKLDVNTGYNIDLLKNSTNSKVIVGEVAPYISYVSPNPVKVGEKFAVQGLRLNDSTGFGLPSVFIDGEKISGVDGSKDGTFVFFVLPQISAGNHIIHLENANGKSNNVGFTVEGPMTPVVCPVGYICTPVGEPSYCPVGYTCEVVTINCPQGYTCSNISIGTNVCYTFTKNLTIGSTGADVVALQELMMKLGYWPTGSSMIDAMGQFGSTTLHSVRVYQDQKGIYENGYDVVGPLTRASLNAECNNDCPSGYTCTNIVQPEFTFVSSSATSMAGTSINDDVGTFRIKFKVTAMNGDIYIPAFSEASNPIYYVDKAGVPVTSVYVSKVLINSTDSDTTNSDNWLVEEGNTEQFELTVNLPMGWSGLTAGQYRVTLGGVKWGTSDDSHPESTTEKGFENYKTSYLFLN